jgi:hypothetical protein
LPGVAGSDFRLNRESLNEIANIRYYPVINSFIWFKEVRLSALGNKKTPIAD